MYEYHVSEVHLVEYLRAAGFALVTKNEELNCYFVQTVRELPIAKFGKPIQEMAPLGQSFRVTDQQGNVVTFSNDNDATEYAKARKGVNVKEVLTFIR